MNDKCNPELCELEKVCHKEANECLKLEHKLLKKAIEHLKEAEADICRQNQFLSKNIRELKLH